MNSVDAENLMVAMVSAYVWIATSDDAVESIEFEKFKNTFVESPFATQIAPEDMTPVRHCFKDMVSLFNEDFEKAMDLTRTRLRTYASSPMISEEIFRVSRAAVVAYGKIEDVEETVLREISKELGISKAN